eukprot:1160684-Pelagomonas_calceolata.AAC.6
MQAMHVAAAQELKFRLLPALGKLQLSCGDTVKCMVFALKSVKHRSEKTGSLKELLTSSNGAICAEAWLS